MATLVALLRGINLASTNRVSMPELRALLAEAGFAGVRTHLQSGNVVLETEEPPAAAAAAIAERIERRLGLRIDVIVRTAEELAAVVASNPFDGVATEPSRQFVAFLAAAPDAAAARALEQGEWAPDRVVVIGREIHAWCPEGMRDSRLMKELGRNRLGGTATVRNWRTVTAVHALATGASGR